VLVADLDLDSGYCGTVFFETRWYGVYDTYSDYVSETLAVTVDTTQNHP
jgi:hypothetical protein